MTDGPVAPTRVALASLVGTTVEFYDFFIYGTAAALVFPRLFFPVQDETIGVLLSFATFGVGFLARPLGGVVFGHLGDRVGRRLVLVVTLVGMGVATALMGLLPVYAQVGLLAPTLLVLLRLLQGVAVGGEWGGAVLMAIEHAPPARRGFFGSFTQVGAPAGTVLASLAFLAVSRLPDPAFLSWGWRLPFLFSAVLIAVGLVIRLSISESPAFARIEASRAVVHNPMRTAIERHGREILLVTATYLSQGVVAYVCVAYLVSYATTVAGIGRGTTLVGVTLAALVAMALYPAFGALSDRFGRKTVYLAGVVAPAALAWPAFALVDTGRPGLFVLAEVLLFGVALSPAAGVTGSLFPLLFTADVRYSGLSAGYTLSQVLGSAFAPTVAAALYAATGTSGAVVGYLVAVSVVSAVALSLIPGGWGRREAAHQLAHQLVQEPAVPGETVPVPSGAVDERTEPTERTRSAG